ncbi:Translation factor guf1 mitochondrial [Gonapodya sp. JEL0774]|nr:Translation factor guf1 mitochondrial [Gonapodya sp. JEL0774]
MILFPARHKVGVTAGDLEELNIKTVDLARFPPERVRNFSIIAHIDHGKSTLADRLLEITNTIPSPSASLAGSARNQQVLDKLKVERDRGITVKAQTASMLHRFQGDWYLLNLIDTPGHVDFAYEVSRSLAASQGTLLVVDASQGIQAQTKTGQVANYLLAKSNNLKIVPVINKIDLPGAEPDMVEASVRATFGVPDDMEIPRISAKSGLGVRQLLPMIIEQLPSPPSEPSAPFRSLLFDNWYDTYVGVVCLVAVVDGKVVKGDRVVSVGTGVKYEVSQMGVMAPDPVQREALYAGQVGYLILGMKSSHEARVGDTFHHHGTSVQALPGFQPAKSMLFAGVYPVDSNEFEKLAEAVNRLTLNDSSVSVAKETSELLAGKYGARARVSAWLPRDPAHQILNPTLVDVFRQRLEEEYGASAILSSPVVPYKIVRKGGQETIINNPAAFPDHSERINVGDILEPMVHATLIFPEEYLGEMMQLCGEHRGQQEDYSYLDDKRIIMKYKLPMGEILTDFYDELKSRSSGYATFDYEDIGYESSDLVKMNILLNTKVVDVLSSVLHRSQVERAGKAITKRLKEVIERQLFEVIIQSEVAGKIISRETISALRKNVTAKCYGGDITRKMKLLEKQKEGKKKMRAIGNVKLSQEAFLSIVKIIRHTVQGGQTVAKFIYINIQTASMNGTKDELNVTRDELERIQKALEKEEFKKMFFDYVKEISDPENRKLYEEELSKMELEKGNDVKFVTPEPGFVFKSSIVNQPPKGHLKSDGITRGSKAFVNMCKSDAIVEAKAKLPTEKDGKKGQQWDIPYSLNGREDKDKANKPCAVYDFMVHPDTIKLAEALPGFRNLLVSVAIEGVERQFHVKLNPKYKSLNMKYKGTPNSIMIRDKKIGVEPAEETTEAFLKRLQLEQEERRRKEEDESRIKQESERGRRKLVEELADLPISPSTSLQQNVEQPKYEIIHKGMFDLSDHTERSGFVLTGRPEQLVVRIQLPGVASMASATLDTSTNSLDLHLPSLYELHLTLPFPVDADRGSAKFDKGKQRLDVILPVIRPQVQLVRDACRTDKSETASTSSNVNEATCNVSDIPIINEGVNSSEWSGVNSTHLKTQSDVMIVASHPQLDGSTTPINEATTSTSLALSVSNESEIHERASPDTVEAPQLATELKRATERIKLNELFSASWLLEFD